MGAASRLVVWRHGQTEWNVAGRMQGQTDVPLDQIGVAQARAIAPELAALRPVALYSSDLARASRTAQALADLTGLEIRPDARLREIDTGRASGLTPAEFRKRYGEPRHGPGPDEPRGGDGETERQVSARVAACLDEIARNHGDGDTVVCASHGVAARVGVCALVGLEPPAWRALSGLDNASYVIVQRFGELGSPGETSPKGPGHPWRIVEWGAGDAARLIADEAAGQGADERASE